MARIAILGAGAWGSALAISLTRNHQVTLWSRSAEQAEALNRERRNTRYLPQSELPEQLEIDADLAACVTGAELALVVTPTSALRATLRSLRAHAPALPVIWACKGFESGSGLLASEVAADELAPGTPSGVLTGPSFAHEVAAGLPCAVLLASAQADFAHRWVQTLHHPRLRLYASIDLVGAQICGAVKNVLAIAAGISDGMGFGHNARAALITRGLAETARLGHALGARPETFMGLAGMGDMILTCTGDSSRNRRVGLMLAEGRALPDILQALGHVAEGVPTAREVARKAAQQQVEMPITVAVCQVLDGVLSPAAAMEALMSRDPKDEAC